MPKGYLLSLGDENTWWLTGKEDMLYWLDKFAGIMELEPCKSGGSPKLIFSKMNNGDKPTRGKTDKRPRDFDPAEDWTFNDYNTLRIWSHNLMPDIRCEVNNNGRHGIEFESMWTALQPIYQQSINKGGLPFHAALIESAGKGFLLVSSGGTGKSTCCRRLAGYAKPLCDDETLVVYNENKLFVAHPFPTWSDYFWKRAEKTWNVQYQVPLCAIFFLERSEVDEVLPVDEIQSVIFTCESAIQVLQKFWKKLDIKYQRNLKTEIFNNACKLSKMIPAFHLRVSLTGRLWKNIKNALSSID